MSQICLVKQAGTPQTPTGNNVRVWIGNDGVLRSIDSTGTITNYAPSDLIGAFLQYTSNSNLSTSSTSGVAIPMATNLNSAPSTYLTKVNDTDFRVNVKSFVRVNFTANPYSASNNRGYRVFIRQNSTDLQWTECYGWSKNLQDRSSGTSGSHVLQCEVNDIIQLRIASPEGAGTNVDSGKATMNVEIFKLRS